MKTDLEKAAQVVRKKAGEWANSSSGKRALNNAAGMSRKVRADLRKAKDVDVALLNREMTV